MQTPIPTRIERLNESEFLFEWSTGQQFALAFAELRFFCPCASCVNEITGQRMINRTQVKADIRPLEVNLIGRYAIKIDWSDGHSTGMYAFDRMLETCEKSGRRIEAAPPVGPQEPICG